MAAFSEDVLKNGEKALMRLRALYRAYGYTRYEMSKFEEYELYARNKSFLVSDDIITFTGSGGKLMALRPDVTLSIVKNSKDGDSLRKLYYNENVYRPSGEHEFKERMQVGLECIGALGAYETGEAIYLACRSLSEISPNYCLDISHMGFLSGLLESAATTPETQAEILRRVSEKNVPELTRLCAERGLPQEFRARIAAVAALYGSFEEKLAELETISVSEKTDGAIRELRQVVETVRGFGDKTDVRLDFSIVNDMRYYSGVIFQGYVDGIPTALLSGGRYDSLMRKFGKRAGAVGFAVYIDLLERLETARRREDADVLLLYGERDDPVAVAAAVRAIADAGNSVRAQRGGAEGVKYKRRARLTDGGVEYDD
ncbi:MAG: ATP phosphoribosyltransferase regulatory subunit [Oscillospiraceae bacterium]|jgi:ATP phosphoribosyltransferase regulatory subunit|nr:ATP phosphoribosyltransferase regulatory subunit [Oscillospiraceae bacterium]